jgi:hypothetical protein
MENEMPTALEDASVRQFLRAHCRSSEPLRAYAEGLWEDYSNLAIADVGHFVNELTSGSNEKFWQRMWEMQLGRTLTLLGHNPFSPAHGPDYQILHGGSRIWIEAISPSPKGLPADWMQGLDDTHLGTVVRTLPHENILLKWTAAFKEKCRKFETYARDGITSAGDACVIAINGSQLGHFVIGDSGISQMPWVVETVFPVGPLQVPVNQGKIQGPGTVSERFEIRTRNDSPVGLYPFLVASYSGISAAVGCNARYTGESNLPLCVVHNPMATVKLPMGLFGPTAAEWVAVPTDAARLHFDLTRIQ